MAWALIALWDTPRRASGTSATMISALKITADLADCGVFKSMTFSTASTGNATTTWPG
jgi:hypothetical protein